MSRKETPLIALNKRIQALGAERQLAAALQTFHSIKKSGLYPSVVSYNVALYACVRCGALAPAEALFKELCATSSLAPTVITYTTMVKGFCVAGRIADAACILRDMTEAGVHVNLRTVNAFLRGCLWHGKPMEALDCFNKIPKWGLVPDRVSIDYTARVCASALMVTEAASVLAAARGLTPDAASIAAVATACAMAGKPNRCARLLEEAEGILAGGGAPAVFEDRDEEEEGRGNLAAFLAHKVEETKGDISRTRAFLRAIDPVAAGAEEAARAGSKKRRREEEDAAPEAVRAHDITSLAPYYARTFLFHNAPAEGDRDAVVAAVLSASSCLGLHYMLKHRSAVEGGLRAVVSAAVTSCFSKGDTPAQLRWSKVFRASNAASSAKKEVRMEICSGTGDWLVHQARANPDVNWVGVELRHHRLTSIFTKVVFNELNNVAVLGGDARVILGAHVKPNSVDHVVVSFPEPPAAHDKDAHLCDPKFFKLVNAILKPCGTLTVVTDNGSYAEMVVRAAKAVRKKHRMASALGPRVRTAGDGIGVGIPDVLAVSEEGGTTGSYFDKLWSVRSKGKRYHMVFQKQDAPVGEEGEGEED